LGYLGAREKSGETEAARAEFSNNLYVEIGGASTQLAWTSKKLGPKSFDKALKSAKHASFSKTNAERGLVKLEPYYLYSKSFLGNAGDRGPASITLKLMKKELETTKKGQANPVIHNPCLNYLSPEYRDEAEKKDPAHYHFK